VTPSANRLLGWIAALFGEEVMARVFHPLVADWQYEMRHAGPGLPRLRSAIAGTFALCSATLFAATAMAAPWRSDPTDRRRVLRAIGVFTGVGTAILLLPFIRYLGNDRAAWLLVALLPSSLPLALALALLPALVRIGSHAGATPTRRALERLRAIGVAGAAVLLILLCVGWLGPLANQQWRQAISGRALQPGLRELTLPQLSSAHGHRFDNAAMAREWRLRTAVAIGWPVTLALLGWRLGLRGTRATTRTMIGCWLGAAMLVGVTEAAFGRDAPWLITPLLWLLIEVVLRPRAPTEAQASRVRPERPRRGRVFTGEVS
jgi:hypothetical protein